MDTAVVMNENGDYGIPVPDYIEENVSTKAVKIIQSYTGVVDNMVLRTVWPLLNYTEKRIQFMYATLNEIGRKFKLAGELYNYEVITIGNINSTYKVTYMQDGNLTSYLF